MPITSAGSICGKNPVHQIVAQRNYVELVNYVSRLEGFFVPTQRGGVQPSPWPGRPVGRKLRAKIDPTILFDDKYKFSLGGVEFDLFSTPGETPDHLTVWLPASKIAFIGDNYNGFGEPEPMSFPNLFALRGTKPRWALTGSVQSTSCSHSSRRWCSLATAIRSSATRNYPQAHTLSRCDSVRTR